MMRQDIDINGYWTIIVLYNVYLRDADTGFTYTDFNKKRSIVGISNYSSKEQFFNTLIHEAKHVQSHICKYYNIKENSEDAAYLIGYIVQKMYKSFKNIL